MNQEGVQTCTSCQAFLPHRYLWAVGQGPLGTQQLGQRYVWQHQRVVLDTEPGVIPKSPEPVPPSIWPYLMLAPHGLHVPQPYALLDDGGEGLLLLDAAAIASDLDGPPQVLPSLREAWLGTGPLRQLNWLWQVAGLWSDFLEQQVASSLLSNHLRVQGSLVRLLELSPDAQVLTLGSLGAFWKNNLLLEADTSIRDFLETLCHQLIEGEITSPDVLIGYLDQAIATSGDGYQVDCELSVRTDQGPSRKRNEDACYPASGVTQLHSLGPKARDHRPPLLLLVCDGIGGHDGGDVASRLAIATIQHELAPLLEWLADQPLHDPNTVTLAIEQAIGAANDNISQHNDQGQRQARDRMGTTIVMALVVGIYIYIGHVGDSRAYRISSTGCHQITFDDDVAAREVRLGYGFYADLTHRPGTGALIQALGMGPSAALHVVVQRLILDEDIALLLCSDGLSDYDRVEQSWSTQVLPLLTKQTKVATTVTDLVQLANTYNGHDNITVGVVAARIKAIKPSPVSFPATITPATTTNVATQPRGHQVTPTQVTAVAQPLPLVEPSQRSNVWPLFLGLISTLGAATVLTVLFFRDQPADSPAASPLPETIQDKINRVGISDDELAGPSLVPRSYLQLSSPAFLLRAPQTAAGEADVLGQLPEGAIVQVMTRQELAGEQSRWIKLQTCVLSPAAAASPTATSPTATSPTATSPTVTSSEVAPLTSGAEGWILESELAQIGRTARNVSCPSD